MKNKIKFFVFAILLVNSFLILNTANAAIMDSFPCAKAQNQPGAGDCTLEHFIILGVEISKWILAICGSLALLAFVVGGIMLLTSAGNPQMVEKGKAAITAAVIGLVIIFTSWLVVKFVVQGLGGKIDNGLNIEAGK